MSQAGALFLTFQAFYLLTASGRLHTIDEYEAFYTAESFAAKGSLSLPGEKFFFGRRGLDGKYYAPYGPLPSILAAPGCLAGKALAAAWGLSPAQEESLTWFSTSIVNSTFAALGVAVFFRLALRLGASPPKALGAAAIYGLATPQWHYGTTFFSEPLSTLLLLLSLHALTGASRGGRSAPLGMLLAGIFPAAAVGVRLTMAIYLPLLGILAFAAAGGSRKNRVLSAALYSVLPTLAVGLYLGWNHLRFGSFLETGYPQLSEGARTVSGFGERFWRGFYGLTWSPGKGLFIFAPSALLGLILAGPYLARTGLRGLTILLLPVLALFFYSKYNYWEGGYSWGPRYLVPAAACWVLPLAFRECDSPAERWATRGAAAFGAAFQALGVSVSFLECQVGRGYYSPGFIYDLRYSSLEAHLAVFAHYLGEAFRGNLLREQEGLGFDRWFFFLRKSGFSAPLLALAVGGLCLALAGSLWWLRRASIAAAGAEAVAPPPALQTDKDASGSRADIESKEAAQCL